MRFTQFVIVLAFAACAAADSFDDIGVTSLRLRPGALLANGAGVTLAQVEAAEYGAYTPNINNGDFLGKGFSFFGIGQQPVSAHGTNIAADIYGNSDGVAPGVKKILLFSNDSFLFADGLGTGMTVLPAVLKAQVINNSWVGNMSTKAANTDALRRLDYMIVRDNVFVANALDNTNTAPVKVLLAAAFNGMNVGITPGLGNTFTAQASSSFHLMPDLIVPVGTTSQASAYVAGSAALLISEAKAHKQPVSALGVRASLMAGAQRLSGWKSTAASPLDPVQGAGQLRVDHSFDILMGGERAPGSFARSRGWDSAVADPNRQLFYDITLTRPATHFSAALIWNREISNESVPFVDRTVTLANLDLQLQRKKGKTWVDAGHSYHTGDNVEFIAREALIAGTYRLAVKSNRQETFALAWYSDFTPLSATQSVPLLATAFAVNVPKQTDSSLVVPEPVSMLWSTGLALLCCRRRNRQRLT